MPKLRFSGGVVAIELPPTRMSPAVMSWNPASIISSVVLPEPDGPSSVRNSPARMSSDTPSTAVIFPYCLVTFWKTTPMPEGPAFMPVS